MDKNSILSNLKLNIKSSIDVACNGVIEDFASKPTTDINDVIDFVGLAFGATSIEIGRMIVDSFDLETSQNSKHGAMLKRQIESLQDKIEDLMLIRASMYEYVESDESKHSYESNIEYFNEIKFDIMNECVKKILYEFELVLSRIYVIEKLIKSSKN